MPFESNDSTKHLPIDPSHDSAQASRRLLDATDDKSSIIGTSKLISRDTIQKTFEPSGSTLPQYADDASRVMIVQEQPVLPVHHIGAFGAPIGAATAGITAAIGIGAREGIPKLYESAPLLAGKTVAAALAVTGESYAQSGVAAFLADSGHTGLGRIAEPNMPGAIAKTSAMLLGDTWKAKGMYLGVAEAIELETNMTTDERVTTAIAGIGATVAAEFIGGRKLAATMAIANVGVFAASTVASWGFYGDLSAPKVYELQEVK